MSLPSKLRQGASARAAAHDLCCPPERARTLSSPRTSGYAEGAINGKT